MALQKEPNKNNKTKAVVTPKNSQVDSVQVVDCGHSGPSLNGLLAQLVPNFIGIFQYEAGLCELLDLARKMLGKKSPK